MSTTTYTLPANRLEFVIGADEVRSLVPTTLSFTFEGDVSTFSYTVEGGDDLLPLVDIEPEALELVIGGTERFGPEQTAFDFEFFLGQLNWTGGVSYILDVLQEPANAQFGDSGFDYLIFLGGAPLPEFASPLELATFVLLNEDNLSEVPRTATFGPGRDIPFSIIPDIEITQTTDPEPAPQGPTEGPDALTGGDDPDDIDGLGGNDTIRGGGANDTLDGGAGDDTVLGDAGDDLLIDGTGNDLVRGGPGNDTIMNEGGLDTFLGDGGRDLLITDVTGLDPQGSFLLVDLATSRHGRADSASFDRLDGIEDFTGRGPWDMEVYGNNGANRLETGSGNDFLDGRGGADMLVGGDGGDVYVADKLDTIIELPDGTGIDELQVTENTTLDIAGIEQLTAVGTGNIRLDGTAGAEILVGNSGANILVGFGGEDTMTGGAGADTFVLTAQRGTDPNVSVTDWRDGDLLAIDDQLLGLGRRGIDIRELTLDVFRDLRDSGAVGYNGRTGELRLDIDGDGNRELVATLEGGAQLGLEDVLLF